MTTDDLVSRNVRQLRPVPLKNKTRSGRPLIGGPYFQPDHLPNAKKFYREELPYLKANGKGWAVTLCPFHKDHKRSFAVHLERGAFTCHTCEAKGEDLVAFIRLRDGCDFETACKMLGAWK